MKKKTKRKVKKGGMFSCFSCKKSRREIQKEKEIEKQMEIERQKEIDKQMEIERQKQIERAAEMINVSIIRIDTGEESQIQINPYKNIYQSIGDYNNFKPDIFSKRIVKWPIALRHKIISSVTFGGIEIPTDSTWKDLNIEDDATLNVTLSTQFLQHEQEMIQSKKLEEEAIIKRIKQQEKTRIEKEKKEKKIMEQERKRILSLPENEQHIIEMDKKLTQLIEERDYAQIMEEESAKNGSGTGAAEYQADYFKISDKIEVHINKLNKLIENERDIYYIGQTVYCNIKYMPPTGPREWRWKLKKSKIISVEPLKVMSDANTKNNNCEEIIPRYKLFGKKF